MQGLEDREELAAAVLTSSPGTSRALLTPPLPTSGLRASHLLFSPVRTAFPALRVSGPFSSLRPRLRIFSTAVAGSLMPTAAFLPHDHFLPGCGPQGGCRSSDQCAWACSLCFLSPQPESKPQETRTSFLVHHRVLTPSM